jgi:hypothetical protein
MKGCRAIQCLLQKGADWQPEPDDQDFELDSKVFLTGIGDGSPDFEPLVTLPVRHGIDETWVSNTLDGVSLLVFCDSLLMLTVIEGDDTGLPFHPTCFEIFKRISIERLGRVDVNGLWACWKEVGPLTTLMIRLGSLTWELF